MNKLKALYHDFRDLPALIVSVVLGVAAMAFFGYIFYLMDRVQPKEGIGGNSVMNSVQRKADDKALGQDNQENDGEIEEAAEMEKTEVLSDGTAKILSNKDLRDFEVWNGEVRAGEIRRDAPSQISVLKRIGSHVYLGAGDEEMGGYMLFNGPNAVYKLDTEDSSLSKVFDKEDMFTSDISADEKKLVYVERFYVDNKLRNYINVYDLESFESQSYPVSEEYGMAGNAYFSKSGAKLAYEAAVLEPGRESGEVFAMLVIDLRTGKQAKVGSNDSYNTAKTWAADN